MKHLITVFLALLVTLLPLFSCRQQSSDISTETEAQNESSYTVPEQQSVWTLSDEQLYDRLLGGWIGSMIGVAWAAPTEFRYCGTIMPEAEMPAWVPSLINDAFGQDDLYVEIPFMEAMAEHGVQCGVEKMAEKFRDSKFPLWHANMQARKNLQNGLLPPESGSYKYNFHADDIDWQIECDFLGIMYPTLVNAAAQRAFDIGHIMNYGDGVYGGVFITAMHAAAYRASSIMEIVKDGLSVIPENTKFRLLIEDVVGAYEKGFTWRQTWNLLQEKWADDDKCPECGGAINIDAKLNSGYVVIGLLYGDGDFAKTVRIATQCGQDSDCNASSAASILGNYLGASGIDEIYTKDLDWDGRKFSNTNYTFRDIIKLQSDLTRQVLELSGATFNDGVWYIPRDSAPVSVPFEQWEDGISASLDVVGGSNRCAYVQLAFYAAGEQIDFVRIDMGDGFIICGAVPVVYQYSEPGDYTVKCEIKGSSGSELIIERKVTVWQTSSLPGRAVCTVMNPIGGGNKNIDIIRDDVIPEVGSTDSSLQYDTYDGGGKKDFVYAGIEFDIEATLSGVRFTEGKHFWDGGWFDGEPYIEIKTGDSWRKIDATIDRKYPGNTEEEQGASFETYTFTFDSPIRCSGVRIAGKPGGQAYFISISEISPIVEEIHGDTQVMDEQPIIICNVASPTGGGAKDIRVISDGIIPKASSATDSMQYDTYHGSFIDEEVYVGYLWRKERKVSEIHFTEGNHFWNGGWFKNDAPTVEVYVNGAWLACEVEISPSYPKANFKEAFGVGYETYVFRLKEPVSCNGVRLIGTAGGESGFISIAELEVR